MPRNLRAKMRGDDFNALCVFLDVLQRSLTESRAAFDEDFPAGAFSPNETAPKYSDFSVVGTRNDGPDFFPLSKGVYESVEQVISGKPGL